MPKITADEFETAELADHSHDASAQLREMQVMDPGDHIKVPHAGLWHSSSGNSCSIRIQVARLNKAEKAAGTRVRFSSRHSRDGRTVYVKCERVPRK